MQVQAINRNEGSIVEPARATPVVREVDVLVCGGGVSGIGAALGASRTGARTLVLERDAFLGGAATAVLMNTWNVPVGKMTGRRIKGRRDSEQVRQASDSCSSRRRRDR